MYNWEIMFFYKNLVILHAQGETKVIEPVERLSPIFIEWQIDFVFVYDVSTALVQVNSLFGNYY